MKPQLALPILIISCIIYTATAYAWPWDKIDVLDRRVDGSSLKSFQSFNVQLMSDLSKDDQAKYLSGAGLIGFIVENRQRIPILTMKDMAHGHCIKDTLWETLNGLKASDVIAWGTYINNLNIQNLRTQTQERPFQDFDQGTVASLKKMEEAGQAFKNGR